PRTGCGPSSRAIDLAVDGPGGDAEDARGERLVAPRVPEGLLDHLPLDLLHRHADGDDDRTAGRESGPFGHGFAHRLRQVLELDAAAAGEDDRALDGVFEFAHVAGPS